MVDFLAFWIAGWLGRDSKNQAKNPNYKKLADLVRSAGKQEVKITFKENLANNAIASGQQRSHHRQNLRRNFSIEQK